MSSPDDQQHAGPIPVIVGPTAGGKTALAVRTAMRLAQLGRPAEILSADSVQIFEHLDIGSAKPDAAERAGIPHHLIDIARPEDRFTVHDWLSAAERTVEEVRGRGAIPIVAGGTNLYIKAFLDGLFQGPEPDARLRAELQSLPQSQRRAELDRVDPEASSRIHPNDERRTVRALEVYRQTGVPISAHQQQWDKQRRPGTMLFGLDWEPDALSRRINARVKLMMEQGLLDEVRELAPRLGPQSCEALGYKQLVNYLEKEPLLSLDDTVEQIKIETRRFAKNQRTWLRRLKSIPNSRWFSMPSEDPEKIARAISDACGSEGNPA